MFLAPYNLTSGARYSPQRTSSKAFVQVTHQVFVKSMQDVDIHFLVWLCNAIQYIGVAPSSNYWWVLHFPSDFANGSIVASSGRRCRRLGLDQPMLSLYQAVPEEPPDHDVVFLLGCWYLWISLPCYGRSHAITQMGPFRGSGRGILGLNYC